MLSLHLRWLEKCTPTTHGSLDLPKGDSDHQEQADTTARCFVPRRVRGTAQGSTHVCSGPAIRRGILPPERTPGSGARGHHRDKSPKLAAKYIIELAVI